MLASRRVTTFKSLIQPIEELSVRREVVATLLLLAETSIVYIFAGSLLAERALPHTPLPVVLIFAVLFVSRLIPHLLNTVRIWSPQYEIIMAVGLIATMLLVIKIGAFPDASWISTGWLEGTRDALILQENDSLRPVWLLIAFVAFIWIRGKTRAEAGLETAYSMLRLGVIWVVAGLVFAAIAAPEGAIIYSHINAALLGFVVFTLLAIAIARQPEGESAAAWNASWVWILIFVLPVLGIAMMAASTVGILTRETLDLILSALSPLFWLLQISLQAIVLTIAIAAFILVSPLIWFLERQGFRPLSNFPRLDLSSGSRADAEELARATLQIENPARYLIAGSILIGLIWILVRYSFRRRKHWQEQTRPQRESLVDWSLTSPSILRRARLWLEARILTARASTDPEGAEWAATREIRRIYRELLRVNKRREMPRSPGETPREYAGRLSAHQPEAEPDVRAITGTYVAARYSGQPSSHDDAEVTRHAWERYRRRETLHD